MVTIRLHGHLLGKVCLLLETRDMFVNWKLVMK